MDDDRFLGPDINLARDLVLTGAIERAVGTALDAVAVD